MSDAARGVAAEIRLCRRMADNFLLSVKRRRQIRRLSGKKSKLNIKEIKCLTQLIYG